MQDRITRKFEPVPDRERNGDRRNVSFRLYVNRWREHREASRFLDRVVRNRGYGEGVETIVRSLLLYQDVTKALDEARRAGENIDNGPLIVERVDGQLQIRSGSRKR